jgi:5-methyltetrahydrofolate--homocysteine methyltransferase
MSLSYTNRRYLDALADHVVVFAGAMGTSIQQYNLSPEDFGGEPLWGCNDYLVLSRPDVIRQIHAAYLAAGCEVIETNTFRSNRLALREYGLADRVREINQAGAALAREVADTFGRDTGIPRLIVGNMGPSGLLPSAADPALAHITFQELAEVFAEQAEALATGGVDLLLLETQQDILEVKAAVYGINRFFESSGQRLPLQVQVTLDTTGRMLLGTDIAAALAILEPLDLEVIGLNCSTGPDYMKEPIAYLTSHTRKPVCAVPNAGLPLNINGVATYPLEPQPLAESLADFVATLGVRAVGGCCGTTPEHLRAVVDRIKGLKPAVIEVDASPCLASAMRAVSLRQEPPPHFIGERLNTQGSKAAKQVLLADDYDGIVQLAREQAEAGAHSLDICVALTERLDEAAQMRTVVKLLSQTVELPLVLDSTEVEVLRAALEVCPGRPIVNSINLENGPAKAEAVLRLCRDFGAAVIALTIDETGMAGTAARKLEVARLLHDLAVDKHGLPPEALIFDALTFTLATGGSDLRDSAQATLEGIKAIKREFPGVLCSLGVSNVSFGLSAAARKPLNAVFFHHAVAAGMDLAMVNPRQIVPYIDIPAELRELAEDLIFNRREDALARYIVFFETAEVGQPEYHKTSDPTAGMTAEEKLAWQIVHRRQIGIPALIDDCLSRHDPVWVLNHVLLPAMKTVGDLFGQGQLILPYVLQSAEVMKTAVAHLETFLDKQGGMSQGTVVLATVYGDVHEIGKNLVGTIVANNGYTVIDLGIQVPATAIVDRAVEAGADAIGLSALLVSTSKQMSVVVRELDRRGLNLPVLVGGAAINRRFGARLMHLDDHYYPGGVIYCPDAFAGLEALDRLTDPARRPGFLRELQKHAAQESAGPGDSPVASTPLPSAWEPVAIPTPPFWGPRSLLAIPLSEVLHYLDTSALFRVSWGAKNTKGEPWEKLQEEFARRLSRMQSEAQRRPWLRPQAVYGYWSCQSEAEMLLLYAPGTKQEIGRLTFPRQADKERLCLADYFAPVNSGRMDVVALQVVTVGREATAHCEALQAAGDYSEAYYAHGLAVQTAEATASWLHQRIRRELHIGDRGQRYSWGYGTCPDLADHTQIFNLLPAAEALGVSLTSACQLIPEQSTAALVAHHPRARYFTVGGRF